jgi:thiol-disulfide isomerase/thioredoxin
MPRLAKLIVLATLPVVALVAGVLYGMSHSHVHASAPPAALAPFALDEKPAMAPLVAFTDGSGKRHSLGEFRGHYVLLNLWATWCAPCVKELPALARLKSNVALLDVLAVNVGREQAIPSSAFLKKRKADALGTYVDSDVALIRVFGAYGLPLTVLIDPKGVEIARAVGPADWSAPDAIAYFKALTEKPAS